MNTNNKPIIKFMRIDPVKDADIAYPEYMTSGAAGMDIRINIVSAVILESGDINVLPTGIKMEIPEGYEAQIRPRSGLACKHGITIVNSPGTIDSDYRGEIQIALINLGSGSCILRRGDRVAQMVIAKVEQPDIEIVTELTDTERGSGALGHTGIK